MRGERGIALILVMIVTAFLAALGLGVTLAVFMDRLAAGNLAGSIAMLYAVDSAIEIAARELAQAASWDAVLAGAERSPFIDGIPDGLRGIPGGGSVDLTEATNVLNCGKATTCTTAQMNATSRDRPWGVNNARWRLYAYGPLEGMVAFIRPLPAYLAVWVADDGREQDGDPSKDEPVFGLPGHGIVRVHAEAYGRLGARRVVEAELSRVCPSSGSCLPGIRVQSWQELRQPVP